MAVTTLSSREFNQDRARAARAARKGPVYITNRGKPSLVLLSAEEYKRLSGKRESIADMLAMPGVAEIEFKPPRMHGKLFQPVELVYVSCRFERCLGAA